MSTVITVLLILHVLSGFTALITGGISSFTRKGGKAHRIAGKWYFWAMTGVFITAVAVAVLKGRTFLFMIGFFSYYLVVRGYRRLYLKTLGRTQKATLLDWFITVVALLFGISLIVFASLQYLNGVSFWPVPMVFGMVSAGFALVDIRLYVQGPKTKQHWLTGHIASMGGGYVATWTAFVVTNVKFLPQVIVWLAPTVIGGVLISYSIRKYVSKPKKMAASLALLLFCAGAANAQPLHCRLSLNEVGSNLYVQLNVLRTDSSFSLTQRLLPGAQKPLLYTESERVENGKVSGTVVIYQSYRYYFSGYGTKDSVRLAIIDTAGTVIGKLEGSTLLRTVPPSYATVATQLLDTMQRYIFNRSYLDSSTFKTFAATIRQYGMFLRDDLEMIGAVNREMRKLPFTHCSFTKASYEEFSQMLNRQFSGTRPLEYRSLGKGIAYLHITSFNGDGSNIAAEMEKIIKSGASSLIIDLRGNSGGGAGAALQLARYLSPIFVPAGALVTNRWFDSAQRLPVLADYKNFYTFQKGTTLQLIEAMKTHAGVVLATQPASLQFKGKVYILTDHRTASTCEPLVYVFKQKGRATIVGEKTAGAMLSAGGFWLNSGYVLSLPVADYITNDGVRLDKKGVEPDVPVAPEQALQKTLELIASSR